MTDFKVKDIIREKPSVDCVIAEKILLEEFEGAESFYN